MNGYNVKLESVCRCWLLKGAATADGGCLKMHELLLGKAGPALRLVLYLGCTGTVAWLNWS